MALRRRFPVLERKTYLNSGSYCALADTVREAINAYMDDRLLVGANWDVWVTKNEAVRAAMAQVLRAQPDEIAVTASASAGHQRARQRLRLLRPAQQGRGQRLRVPDQRADLARAGAARRARGARRREPPTATSRSSTSRSAIDEETQLVAVTHVCFRNGAMLDVAGIARLAHAQRREGPARLLPGGRRRSRST